ncbi:MAG: hypothetical protein AB2A00_30940 [Myxococcota bacterium]
MALRFANVGIPRGATVLSAAVQFEANDQNARQTDLVIEGVVPESSGPFTATSANITSRSRVGTSVTWSPPEWVSGGDRLAEERTSDVGPILQDIVSRPEWNADQAVVLLFRGTGKREARSRDTGASNAAQLYVEWKEPTLSFSNTVCLPPALNPGVDGGVLADQAALEADCAGRVQDTVRGLNAACNYPSACTCTATPDTLKVADSCNSCEDDPNNPGQRICDGVCHEVPLAGACANFDPEQGVVTATNVAGDTPVCITSSPLAAGLFGRLSHCQATGNATIVVRGESDKHPAASGVVEISGQPCPGASCSVGLRYDLDVGPVTYSRWYGSRTFEDMAGLGASHSGEEALINGAGDGVFAAGATDNTLRGRSGSDVRAFAGSNTGAFNVGVVFGSNAPECEVSGNVVGNTDPQLSRCENAGPNADAICLSDDECADVPECSDGICNCVPVPVDQASFSILVGGPLLNQPPVANAGPDRDAECDQPGAATVTLSTQITDYDGNLAQVRWTQGTRLGTLVGVEPTVVLEQAVGTSATYVVRVLDTYGQGDEDDVVIRSVDTADPVLSCNAPATIVQSSRPVSFHATATDVCDASVQATITGFECFKLGRGGRRIDTGDSCEVLLNSQDGIITIINAGGVGNHIRWFPSATDDAGNTATGTCEVVVVKR